MAMIALVNVSSLYWANTTGATQTMVGNIVPRMLNKTTKVNSQRANHFYNKCWELNYW